jgi:hypothetical protein
MTGLPDFNYPQFHAQANWLRGIGWDVENPAEYFDGDQTRERKEYLTEDLRVIAKCDAIWMLDGWRNSPGARLEHMYAEELGLEIKGAAEPPIELEASRLVRNGARQQAYGHPREDFKRTAAMWSAFLGVELTAHQATLMMAMLKISRLAATPEHRDSIVDLVGYSIVYDRLGEPE